MKFRVLGAFASAAFFAACTFSACETTGDVDPIVDNGPGDDTPAPPANEHSSHWGGDCDPFAFPTLLGEADAQLNEVSGLVVSRQYCGVGWVHNDSGDAAQIYALELDTGRLLSTVVLVDVRARDFEAISMSECEEGWCIFVGDIGDNPHSRDAIAIHRLVEPDPYADTRQEVAVKSMTATYELGPHDAESLLSEGEELYILSKRVGESRLYHATFEERADASFRLIEEITWGQRIPKGSAFLATGADFATSPPRVLLRGYFAIVEMIGEDGDDIPAVLARGKARELPGNLLDFQGEAIGYGPGGFYHLPELVDAPIRYSGCESGRTPTCEDWQP